MGEVKVNRREDGITLIQINRQHARNAVNSPTAKLLLQAVRQFENSDSRVAILYGLEDFCAGFDLKQALSHHYQSSNSLLTQWQLTPQGRGPMGPTRFTPSKPVIAAVTGYCVAGGLELAVWCDMIVSHPQAVFGVFCRRVGVPLMDGGTIRLTQIVGLNRARDMVLTGRQVSGRQAHEWGLVNRLVEKSKVLEQAIKLATTIGENPQITMLSDRKSMMQSAFGDLQSKISREFELGMESLMKGGAKQGVEKFNSRKIKPKL